MILRAPSLEKLLCHMDFPHAELEKVPLSASVLVRKDFGIREHLRKPSGGKNQKSYNFRRGKNRKNK